MREKSIFKISNVSKIIIPAKDLNRAQLFYKDFLGLKYLYTVKEIAYFTLNTIEIQLDSKLDIVSSEIFYMLSDVEIKKFYQKLISGGAKGIEPPTITNQMRDRDIWQAILIDTEGNRCFKVTAFRPPWEQFEKSS